MSVLAPTPKELLCDPAGRPYFLWDVDITLSRFREELESADPPSRAYWIGKLMRQAKPDDVFTFVSRRDIAALWSDIVPHLGKTREFWTWLFSLWRTLGLV